MTNTEQLKKELRKKDINLDELSRLTGISRTTLSYKINNKVEFKTSEIKSIQSILKLSDKKRDSIFFT